jgi:hypothetical protein
MRKFTFVALAVVASVFTTNAFAGSGSLLQKRCAEDSLTPVQAKARVYWFLDYYFDDARAVAESATFESLTDDQVVTYWENTCLKSPTTGALRARRYYPTFALANLTNPVPYYAYPNRKPQPQSSFSFQKATRSLGYVCPLEQRLSVTHRSAISCITGRTPVSVHV